MKYLNAIFRDKFLLLAAFFILLPTGFKLFFGVEGKIFLADPNLHDPNFSFSVLYMVDHSVDGAEAIVLNRPYPNHKKKNIPLSISSRNIPVYWGGPLNEDSQIQIMQLKGDQKPKIISFEKWMAEDIDILDKIDNSPQEYRIYIGSAQWQPFQYEMERISNAWVLGADRTKSLSQIFSQNRLDQNAIWLKILYISDFYKRPSILGKITA